LIESSSDTAKSLKPTANDCWKKRWKNSSH
jgi:hypothetical protein